MIKTLNIKSFLYHNEISYIIAVWAHGLVVMTTPLQGVDPQFESGWAHSFCGGDLAAMIGRCQRSHPSSNLGHRISIF